MLRFGPLRHHWCMRFESKNAQIKRFLSPQSFKNVPLGIAIHHQMWMCYQLLTQPGQIHSNFLYSGDEICSGIHTLMWYKENMLLKRVTGKMSVVYCFYLTGSQITIDRHVEEVCTLCSEKYTSSTFARYLLLPPP